MTDLWLGYADRTGQREVVQVLKGLAPGASVVFAESPEDLRERFLDEEPGTVGAIVGDVGGGVSGVNLAAALAHDGRASEVLLVARGASGSLRSRARRAGIARVLDPTAPPVRAAAAPSPTPAPGLATPAEPRTDEVAAPLIAVMSGRGGVGKTSLVALLAAVAGSWGMRVAAVDLDLSCGNLHTFFGIVRSPDLARMAADGAPSAEALGRAGVRCGGGVRLWGPCERPEMAELVMPHVGALLSHLSTQFDLVVVDTSTTFTDAVAQAVQSCDRLLVVHDGHAGAVASAARMSALAVRLGVARTRIVRVEGLADPRVRRGAFEGRAEVGLETARLFRVPDGGEEAEELLLSGKVAELVSARSEPVGCVSQLLAQLLSDLGRLPESEEARKALAGASPRRGLQLFGRRREAV